MGAEARGAARSKPERPFNCGGKEHKLLLQTLGNHLKDLEHRKCLGKNYVSGQLDRKVHRTQHSDLGRENLWESFSKGPRQDNGVSLTWE